MWNEWQDVQSKLSGCWIPIVEGVALPTMIDNVVVNVNFAMLWGSWYLIMHPDWSCECLHYTTSSGTPYHPMVMVINVSLVIQLRHAHDNSCKGVALLWGLQQVGRSQSMHLLLVWSERGLLEFMKQYQKGLQQVGRSQSMQLLHVWWENAWSLVSMNQHHVQRLYKVSTKLVHFCPKL